jgi:hypothetical protein
MFQNVALASAVDESDIGVKVDVGDIVRFVPESISCSFPGKYACIFLPSYATGAW